MGYREKVSKRENREYIPCKGCVFALIGATEPATIGFLQRLSTRDADGPEVGMYKANGFLGERYAEFPPVITFSMFFASPLSLTKGFVCYEYCMPD